MSIAAFTRNGLRLSISASVRRSLTPASVTAVSQRRSSSSEELMELEKKFSSRNYAPLPVVFDKAEGVHVWDCEGRHYYDFLSAYSAVNQGHCHPKLVATIEAQVRKCTLSSRAFFNAEFPRFAQYITDMFGYDRVLPMNSGAEAVEAALKVARRWAYRKKGVPHDEALIVSATECFHGRSIAMISMSNDEEAREDFGPFLPGLRKTKYNDIEDFRQLLEKEGDKIAAYLMEPIQGEAGIIVPDDEYVREVATLCKKHNVLLINDEIQSGLCRSGKMLAMNYPQVRGDMLVLGKAISGGTIPLSCVLADSEIMDVLTPGSHGSTYGGNPMACAVGVAALEVLQEENLAQNSFVLGEKFRAEMQALQSELPFVSTVRGRGLLNGVVIDTEQCKVDAKSLCIQLKENGLLAKPTHDTIIRFAPPLVITEGELDECLDIIRNVFKANKL